ncbi:MAG TPA: hypothetical protein VGS78_02235 [Candidatus Sulfotelmatobacter sp.]|nr:hypothetical protein [Candidatus Sulfotelmatobacter sp.]
MLSHEFLNKLSVIIGSCDLLLEKREQSPDVNASTTQRIEVIRGIAQGMVDELKEHLCELDEQARMLLEKKTGAEVVVTTCTGARLEVGTQAVDGVGDPLPVDGEGDQGLLRRRRATHPH